MIPSSILTNRFINGLKDEIQSVVLVHRPGNLDTASSIALLQEETIKDIPKKEYKKETNYGFRYSGRSCANSFHPHNNFKGASGSSNQNIKSTHSNKTTPSEDKATTPMNYRKAKDLCYKCGMKWHPGHKCATSVPLQVVEELWKML